MGWHLAVVPTYRQRGWRLLAILLLLDLAGWLQQSAGGQTGVPSARAEAPEGYTLDLAPQLPPLLIPSATAAVRLPHARPLIGPPPTGEYLLTSDDGSMAADPSALAMGAPIIAQELTDQATLETRQPEVQWSAAGATDWQSVPTRQTVAAGDRARTGPRAGARLIYFEGTVTELGPETGLLVERLERSPEGNLFTR